MYFSNPPLKEKALALNNNLPPLLLSTVSVWIQTSSLHNSAVLWSYGTKGNFVTNSGVTNSLFGCGDGGYESTASTPSRKVPHHVMVRDL